MEAIQKELRDLVRTYLSNNPGSERQLADELGASIPIIKHWASGKNSPPPIIAQPLVEKLKEILQKQDN
ncbi:hypothetical protein MYX06_02030 [Patescibacteria group bacterium AH-259-L05]|nr:hypothetical protein [Patescibacteria group bacterium AH-259-L05]